MGRKNEGRVHMVHFALTKDEYNLLENGWKKSIIITFSEYIRRVLFEKPITFYTRNQSLDELVTELILLRRELNAIRKASEEAVLRLHMQDHLPEIRRWLEEFGHDQVRLISNVEEIKTNINSVSALWLQ